MILSLMTSLVLLLPSLLVVGNISVNQQCDLCVLVEPSTDSDADPDLAGNFK